jgi:hypothetical protein
MLLIGPTPHADHFVTPRVMEGLKKESEPSSRLLASISGLPFVAMENQKADCWIISDPYIAEAYRNGYISEDVLKRMNDRMEEIRASRENDPVERAMSDPESNKDAVMRRDRRLVPVPTAEERAANHRALSQLHVGNRFRLMFGMPMLPQPGLHRRCRQCAGECDANA